jgi:hypothetical protein
LKKFHGFREVQDGAQKVDFLWQNTPTQPMVNARRACKVYSHISGSEVLEDKSSLALLQRQMTVPTLVRALVGRTNHHAPPPLAPLIPHACLAPPRWLSHSRLRLAPRTPTSSAVRTSSTSGAASSTSTQ